MSEAYTIFYGGFIMNIKMIFYSIGRLLKVEACLMSVPIIISINMVLPPGKKENIMSNQKHLTLNSRITIETLLNQGNNFKYIATVLEKDCTTISKEIKKHIYNIN